MQNTRKSAAVPFVNKKGERSMKRVKVERYVAGKRPAYAKDDEDEEYYTTDEDESGNEQSHDEDIEESGEELEQEDLPHKLSAPTSSNRELQESSLPYATEGTFEDEEEDDPRFRKLKQIDSKTAVDKLLQAQTHPVIKQEHGVMTVEEDEEEEEIRKRHIEARARLLQEPIGPQAVLGDIGDGIADSTQVDSDRGKVRKVQLSDILMNSDMTTGAAKKSNPRVDHDQIQDMIETAKQRSVVKNQLVKRIEEDNKADRDREERQRTGIGGTDINSVNTDDEDEELAYEEWKLREIQRVARDRSERALEGLRIK